MYLARAYTRLLGITGVAACIISLSPVILFGIYAAVSHNHHLRLARVSADTMSDVVHENVRNKFEVFRRVLGFMSAASDGRSAREFSRDATITRLTGAATLIGSGPISAVFVEDDSGSFQIVGRTGATTIRDDLFRKPAKLFIGSEDLAVSELLNSWDRASQAFLVRKVAGSTGFNLVVSPDAFTTFWSRLGNEFGASFDLIRSDGAVLTSSHPSPDGAQPAATVESSGGDPAVSRPALESSQAGEGITAIRPLAGFPAYVKVSISEDRVLAAWRRSLEPVGILAIAISLMTAGFGVLLFRTARARTVAEAAKVQSDARLSSLVAGLPGIVYQREIAADGSISFPFVSERALGLIGGTDIEGKVASLARSVQAAVPLANAAANGSTEADSFTPASCDFQIECSDGVLRWFRSWESIPVSAQGRTAWDCIALDVTYQLETQNQLRTSREHLARAQVAAAIGSWEWRFGEPHVIWSDETYRIMGFPRDFVPTHVAVGELVLPEDRANRLDLFMTSADNLPDEAALSSDYRINRLDGQVRTIRRVAGLVHDENGRPIGLSGTIQDVTELKLREQRESQLEAQLHQSQRIESLGTLAGGIAHDLNNALLPVVMLSELMMITLPKESSERASAELIHSGGIRARDLVSQILTFSRQSELKLEETDLYGAVAEALKFLRATIPATITIKADLSPVPAILGDETQLYQVILNLLTNASYAIGSIVGDIGVTLGMRPSVAGCDPSGGDVIVLTVTDTGCGMEEAVAERIFEPFFTTKPVGEGTGLGLAVVHGIVSSHRGRIFVDSAPGCGSTFTVELPCKQSQSAALLAA